MTKRATERVRSSLLALSASKDERTRSCPTSVGAARPSYQRLVMTFLRV
jgi:hypothetical protein